MASGPLWNTTEGIGPMAIGLMAGNEATLDHKWSITVHSKGPTCQRAEEIQRLPPTMAFGLMWGIGPFRSQNGGLGSALECTGLARLLV
jgi:hypothetical protein